MADTKLRCVRLSSKVFDFLNKINAEVTQLDYEADDMTPGEDKDDIKEFVYNMDKLIEPLLDYVTTYGED